MISFPNAKINLGLHIVSKRSDSFHNIETLMIPIAYYDVLEIIKTKDTKFELNISGNTEPINIEDNLCTKAYKLLQKNYGISGVKVHLHKNIATGAGLGGGSANAAFTLKILNEIFKLNLSAQELQNFASQLGSDCAFFIENEAAFSSGRGEVLQKANMNFKDLYVFIIVPEIHISTADAYKNCIVGKHEISLFELLKNPQNKWKSIIENDFEDSVFKIHPILETIKTQIYEMG
ncbi:MAG: 4-(cytidine 5'-diphospho)-2-C-methyl-D-erythritol kinase, partial [Bacteroidales bacterium]|nr:4-(cytidine 5'-diphospho)-2-C-methyl-D-erythritol kinase [Bacteroidales bacterium]